MDIKSAALQKMPFPMLKYKHSKTNEIYTMMDMVDTIIAPAMVIPWNIKANKYIEMNSDLRSRLGFYVVPYEFLCRDDWEDIHTQGLRASAEGFKTMTYEEANLRERERFVRDILQAYPVARAGAGQVEVEDDQDDNDEEEDEDEEDEGEDEE